MNKFFGKLLILFLVSFIITACSYKDDKYKVGQIWKYKTRAYERSSNLTVVAIEDNEDLGVIVSVYIEGLKVNFHDTLNMDKIKHMPFSKSALDSSVTKLIGIRKELPDYKNSYRQWKTALKNGDCTIFYKPVKDMIVQTENLINNN
jgi:hypothetical protein